MVSFPRKEHYNMDDFRQVIAILRHPGGCPWDQEQTHSSIRRNFIEEVYEACEGIDRNDIGLMREELGDVMMQVLFHASIEEDAGHFDIDDVADEAVKKLIFRHPHVFGAVEADTVGQVLTNWDELKREEKGQESYTDTLTAVASTLPALWRAEKVLNKAAKAGFVWPDFSGAMGKVVEETREFAEAQPENAAEELGDLLFAVTAAARMRGIDPEDALNQATDKFIRRFGQVEACAVSDGLDMKQLPLPELGRLWQQVKLQEDPKHE